MKETKVVVQWPEGLHLRSASRLVNAARKYRSAICLKHGGRVADARSILAVLMLGAAFGAAVDLEASGEDEDAAISGLTEMFETDAVSHAGSLIYQAPPTGGWR